MAFGQGPGGGYLSLSVVGRVLVASAWLGLAGCSASSGLTIDVRTDYRAGVDFASVQTEVSATRFVSAAPDGAIVSHPAAAGDYARGVRVDERLPLAAGDWYVRVTLLAASGARVAQRAVSVHLSGRTALTVVLARSCEGVVCPTAADPARTECSGGVCVSPTCSPETPQACPTPECASDAECTASPGPCARATCASGVCLYAGDDALCASGTCGSDFRCTAAGVDAGVPDDATAQPDAATGPVFTLWYLPRATDAWVQRTPSGMLPTDPIEAAFAQLGTDEMMLLTHTELFVLRISTLTFVERHPRDAIFPELAGVTIQGASIVNADIFIHSHDAWLYQWSNATRSATFSQAILYENLGADWHGPLTPPWWQLYAMFYVPDNADGWAHVDPMMVCGTSTVNNHFAYLSTDGFGPRAMIVTVYDAGCSQFVDQSLYGSPDYAAFSLVGAPPSPWEIDAAEWYDGLWVFTSPE